MRAVLILIVFITMLFSSIFSISIEPNDKQRPTMVTVALQQVA